MGVEVTVHIDRAALVRLDADIARGLEAGGWAVAELSNSLAPTEPEPKHGEHLTDTVFVRPSFDAGGDPVVQVGYEAFWALWMHEWTHVAHPHGGQAKFLELAVIAGEQAVLAAVAAATGLGLE